MSVHTLIIVESPNDLAFIKVILNDLSLQNTGIISLETVDFKHLDLKEEGLKIRGKDALDERLDRIKMELDLPKYLDLKRISIILDSDSSPKGGIEKSIALVNKAVEKVFGNGPGIGKEAEEKIVSIQTDGEPFELSISCFFMKMPGGEGHLDQVLKAIATKQVIECDCLEAQWRPCVEAESGKVLSGFEKLWVNFYVRAHATSKQKGSMEQKFPEVIEKKGAEIFDLNHPVLDDLKAYLKSLPG